MAKINLSEYAVKRKKLMFFLMVLLIIAGIVAFLKLNRLEDPIFNVPTMTISAIWPGATPQEMQDEVLNQIEQVVANLEQFDYTITYARQGFGYILLWAKEGNSKKSLDESWYQVRKKVNDIRRSLPATLQGPFFNDEYSDVYSVIYNFSSDQMPFSQLYALVKEIKIDLKKIPEVGKIDIYGQRKEKIYIEASSKKIAALGLNYEKIAAVLRGYNELLPWGQIEGQPDRLFVKMQDKLLTVPDIEKLTIQSRGKLLKLSDFVQVKSGYDEPPTYLIRYNGKPVIAMGIASRQDANINQLGKELDKKIERWRNQLGPRVSIAQNVDQPHIVAESIGEFEHSFLEALIIVLGVAFLWLGWRTGLIIAASVPLVLAIVSIIMYFYDWSLNRVTLGALIIALGLLVDDAIISTETMLVKIEEGWEKIRAAVFAYTSTAFPMLTGTLVTIAAFMPVGFAKSGAGEYARGIFYVVMFSLVASWFVSVLFTPVIGMWILKSPSPGEAKKEEQKNTSLQLFPLLVNWCIKHRFKVLTISASLLVIAVIGMSAVQQQFFPSTPRKELLIDVRLREGASIAATEKEAIRVENYLRQQTGIDYFTTYIGAGGPRFFISLAPELPNPGYAQIVIMTKNVAARERLRKILQTAFADDSQFANFRGRVTSIDFGPPVGFPVQFRVIGKDPQQLRKIAYQVLDQVEKSPLVRDTQLDWNEKVRSFRLIVHQDKLQKAGLDNLRLASTLQAIFQGAVVTTLRKGDELIDVVLRGSPEERKLTERLEDTVVFTASGKSLPLSQIATVVSTVDEPVLWRRNRELTITVRSDLSPGVQGPDATNAIWPTLKNIIRTLPEGYRIEQGGIKEHKDKAQEAINAVAPAMVVFIILFLMFQLQSVSNLIMVLLSAPLGIIGVVPALLILNRPFGFVAMLGLIALSGMIMRNTVILVDQIEKNIKMGTKPWDAIVEATVHRARPVFLTALSAILAMIPLSRSLFWGPMAITIMGGLLAATGLTLFFVPALYAAWHRIKQ